MRESRTYGSVRGALSNERPYRDRKRNPSPSRQLNDGFRKGSTHPTNAVSCERRQRLAFFPAAAGCPGAAGGEAIHGAIAWAMSRAVLA
jgi:hypothetical protein